MQVSDTNGVTFHNRGELHLAEEEIEQAIAMFYRSLELSPDNPSTMPVSYTHLTLPTIYSV